MFCLESLVIPSSEREKVLGILHQSHQGITKTQLLAPGCVSWPSINKGIGGAAFWCETCMRFQAQDAAAPLTPMPLTPAGQSNCVKVIHTLEEWFCNHGTLEVLHMDNGSQYASTAFCRLQHWMGFYPWNLQSTLPIVQLICWIMCQNNQAYSTVCQVQWYKSKDCITASQGHTSWCQAPITLSDTVQHQDTYHHTIGHLQHWLSSLEDWVEKANSNADRCSKQLPLFYTDQSITTLDTQRKIWIPATVVCVLPEDSYQVCIANWTTYHHSREHLQEHSVRCHDVVLEAPSATSEQAHTRFPRPVPQPTMTAEEAPQSVTPATPKPKPIFLVSTPAATPNVAAVPTPTTTPSVAPMQPWRSGHAHTTHAWLWRCNWRCNCPWLYEKCTWPRMPINHISYLCT